MKGTTFTDRDAIAVARMVTIARERHPVLTRAVAVTPRWFRISRAAGRYVYVVLPHKGARIIGFLRDRVTVVPNRRNPYARGGGFTLNPRQYMPDRTTLADRRPRPFQATDRVAMSRLSLDGRTLKGV